MAIARLARTRPLIALLLLASVLVTACGEDGPTATTRDDSPSSTAPGATVGTTSPTTPTTPPPPGAASATIQVAGGTVQGPERLRASLGEEVTLVVTSDTADEVHVHAYDVRAPLEPGQPVRLAFTASIPGVFEVELEHTGRRLLTLEVRP